VCILCRLNDIGKMRQIFLSRLMHSARLKWTEGRLLRLVQLLGYKGNWRRAIQVVHWVHCREHFKHCKSRHVYTTLLDVLGKCWRPVEALNMFNVMRVCKSLLSNRVLQTTAWICNLWLLHSFFSTWNAQ
jgi:pentatricopeptide repeat protein